ncbi:IbpA Molecular chaperone (small heat shock protein) [uncultured Caudovirales phage]|jgi:molecular chaperone IbpA|uniref:IbpA Molecular chaperone (Small heat shock protein) n=1 Tax=uncultured Caudovirales phage TaxID=2100421 RepID=A0A6J5KJH6_9CAUD|nr:IbpA Molecular chaperone (small heat shock protein) [uncultured Caudovirales phage]
MSIMPNTGGYPHGDPHKNRYTETSWGTKQPRMPEVTINSLFPQFNRWAIGFDPLLDTFKHISAEVKSSGYPPYNIYKNKDTYVLELAVAGFAREDITISVKELQLTVEGRLEASGQEPIHKGIATRDFKQDFVLAEYVVVKGAELKDGLLRITLEQELPVELQPKVIEIS